MAFTKENRTAHWDSQVVVCYDLGFESRKILYYLASEGTYDVKN